MLQGSFENDESGNILTDNDFRQVAIISNPKQYGSTAAFTGNTAQALQILRLQGGGTAFVEDVYFKQNASVGIAVHWDAAANELYFYQNEETGFGEFVNADAVIDRYSGEVLYIHNQVDVSRAINQTEDVKLIISF